MLSHVWDTTGVVLFLTFLSSFQENPTYRFRAKTGELLFASRQNPVDMFAWRMVFASRQNPVDPCSPGEWCISVRQPYAFRVCVWVLVVIFVPSLRVSPAIQILLFIVSCLKCLVLIAILILSQHPMSISYSFRQFLCTHVLYLFNISQMIMFPKGYYMCGLVKINQYIYYYSTISHSLCHSFHAVLSMHPSHTPDFARLCIATALFTWESSLWLVATDA